MELKKKLLSFLFSCIFLYCVAWFFQDSIAPWVWSPELKCYISVEHIHQKHSEGWGKSTVGALGINGVEDVRKLSPNKIAIWGDSYVEAWQVDDPEKMAQVLSKKMHQILPLWSAFGIGRSGSSIADYYFALPKYEKAINGIKAHIILITQPNEDIVPNSGPQEYHSLFLHNAQNGFFFSEENWKPQRVSLKLTLQALHLDFLWTTMRDIKHKKLHFLPQQQNDKTEKSNQGSKKDTYDIEECYTFIIQQMKQQTTKPLLFAYLPRIPRIEQGHVVAEDNNGQAMQIFADVCHKNNIPFLNLGQNLIAFYDKTNKFPRGFINSKPGVGHLNADGHRVVAEALLKFVESSKIIPSDTVL